MVTQLLHVMVKTHKQACVTLTMPLLLLLVLTFPLREGLVLLLIKLTKGTSIQQRNTNEGNTSKLTLSIVSL